MSAYLSFIGRSRGWALIRGWAPIRGWALIPINTVGAHTTPKFLLRDRRGAASAFRDRNRAAIRYDFRGGAKAIRYSAGAGSFCLR